MIHKQILYIIQMSYQEHSPQLNYYSRYSRRKNKRDMLDTSYTTYTSKDPNRHWSKSRSRSKDKESRINNIREAGNQQQRKGYDYQVSYHKSQERKIIISTDNQISDNVFLKEESIEIKYQSSKQQGQSAEQKTEQQAFGRDFEKFPIKESSVSGKIGEDFSIHSDILKYNLNQSDYYVNNRLFQFGNDSISSIQQGDSLYLGRGGQNIQQKQMYQGQSERDKNTNIKNEFGLAEQTGKRLIVFNNYKDYEEQREQKLNFEQVQKQVSSLKKKNFKSLMKNKNPRAQNKSKQKIAIDQINSKGGEQKKVFVKNSPKKSGEYPSVNLINQFKNQNIEESNESLKQQQFQKVDNQAYQQSDVEMKNSQRYQENNTHRKQSLQNLQSPKIKHSPQNKSPNSLTYRSSTPQKPYIPQKLIGQNSNDKHISSQSNMTLQDKLERIYQLNFGSSNKRQNQNKFEREEEENSILNDNPLRKQKQYKPQIVQFVQISFQKDQEQKESLDQIKYQQSFDIESSQSYQNLKPVKLIQKVKSKQEEKLHQKNNRNFEKLNLTSKQSEALAKVKASSQHSSIPRYSKSIQDIQNLMEFVGTLQQSKRKSYSPLLCKLYANVLKSKTDHQRNMHLQGESLQQLNLTLKLQSQSASWSKHLKSLNSTNNPFELQITNNKIIIESLVNQLSHTVGKQFQLNAEL